MCFGLLAIIDILRNYAFLVLLWTTANKIIIGKENIGIMRVYED